MPRGESLAEPYAGMGYGLQYTCLKRAVANPMRPDPFPGWWAA